MYQTLIDDLALNAGRHDVYGELHLLLSVLKQYDTEPFTASNPYVELFQRLEAIVGKDCVALNRWRQRLNSKIER